MSIPAELRWLFWELAPETVDLQRDAGYVMARVLEHGGMAEVRWLIERYGRGAIHRFLRDVGHSELSGRTIAFWRAAFAAKDETWASNSAWRTNSGVPWNA